LTTTIGRSEPIAAALVTGNCVRYRGELLGAELDRAAEEDLAQRPLVAELDQLADHLVEHRDALQRGGRGAVGGMLVGLRRDLEKALILRKRVGHGAQAIAAT
jgi:hypothetical protein